MREFDRNVPCALNIYTPVRALHMPWDFVTGGVKFPRMDFHVSIVVTSEKSMLICRSSLSFSHVLSVLDFHDQPRQSDIGICPELSAW